MNNVKIHTKIQEINKSHLYGSIVETGCGCAIVSNIYNVAGASGTIFRSEQPYSKQYEEELYGKFPRSVSKEFIESILVDEGTRTNINFVLASSWQLLNPNDPLQYAHGWFGLFDKTNNVKHYLHYSFNRIETLYNPNLKGKNKNSQDAFYREDYIKTIGEIGVSILHTAITGNISELEAFSPYSTILDMAYINDEVNYDLLLSTLEKCEDDYLLAFDNHSAIRIEDLMRKSKTFIIQKGSYDPIHQGHVELMNKSQEKYPDSISSFLISTFRYDKPYIPIEELKIRINCINNIGYPLLICKSILFYETFKLLSIWSYNKFFLLPIGVDTLNRIYQTDIDYVKIINAKNAGKVGLKNNITIRGFVNKMIHENPNYKFLLHNRKGYNRIEETKLYNNIIEVIDDYVDDGVSSTLIREGKMENKLKLD